uniref:Uncharacterized protein n=1 Tax=Echinococcus canadensis TaxID=519352 RepID=A0A915EXL3_9CEST
MNTIKRSCVDGYTQIAWLRNDNPVVGEAGRCSSPHHASGPHHDDWRGLAGRLLPPLEFTRSISETDFAYALE